MKKYIFGIIGFIILLAADRVTKVAAQTTLKGTDGIPVIKGVFRLLYLENRGAAFGVLQNQRFLLLFFTAIILIAVIAALPPHWCAGRCPAGRFLLLPAGTARPFPVDL